MDRDLRLIEEQHPLIHNITNYVAMNFVANSLLAIGASPIMARAQEEVEEICSKSNALALNLGIALATDFLHTQCYSQVKLLLKAEFQLYLMWLE